MRIWSLYRREDRAGHAARHGVTLAEVEEAVFGGSNGLPLKKGPAERNPVS